MTQEPDGQNDHGKQEQDDGQPVDAVHIFCPLRGLIVGILFYNEKILSYLPEYAHDIMVKDPVKGTAGKTIAAAVS